MTNYCDLKFNIKFVATDSMFGEISGQTQIEVTKLASKAILNFEEYASAISFEKDYLSFCGTLIVNKGITLNLGGKTFILAIEYKNGKFVGSDNIADVKNYGTIKNGTINAIDGSTVKEYKKLGTWENIKSSIRWTAFY